MTFSIGQDCQIHPSAIINVKEGHIGDRTIIKENVVIEGSKVIIGNESFLDRNSSIGGGSCFDSTAYLIAGDWLHLGVNSHLNIARGLDVGNEVGFAMDTKVFSHSSWIDSYYFNYKPKWSGVKIGSGVLVSTASQINPGVKIGNNVVIAQSSVVTNDIPENCLVGGVPAKIINDNYLFENTIENKNIVIDNIIEQFFNRIEPNNIEISVIGESIVLLINNDKTIFNLHTREISGVATEESKIFKDQLRRNGIRFRFKDDKGEWVKW